MSNQPDFAQQSPFTRPGFIVAAAAIALIIGGGALVALLPDSGDEPPVASPTVAATTPARSPAASPSVELPTAVPTVAPDGVEWRLFGQVALPYSATAGPRTVTEYTASGFEHSPIGALIAAAHLTTRSSIPGAFEATINKQFVPSPDRDRLLANLRAAPQTPPEPGSLSQTAGFIYQSYTPDAAVVELVKRSPTGRYHVLTLTLLWRDGDWRMQAPPGGVWTSVNRPAPDLAGVIEWGAR